MSRSISKSRRLRRMRCVLGSWGLCFAAFAAPASAQSSDLALGFTARAPASATAVSFRIVYRDPANPEGKPPAISRLLIELPEGAVVDVDSIARCTASDEEIMIQGPSACPPASQVGSGTLTAITGFGPPADPFLTDASIFNTGQGWVEIFRDHQTQATIATDRIRVDGSTLIGNPPAIPGGPPDGRTAVRAIDFTFPASSGYFTTPPSCPSEGAWRSTGAFTFTDGTTQLAKSATPCERQTDPAAARCEREIDGKHLGDGLVGTRGSDRIQGRGGRDRIRGRGGADCLVGGGGRDRIRGGRGADRIRGGSGGDVIRVRHGGRDRVDCGRGHDTVFAGRNDRLNRCEVIRDG